jgi:hypothetical protein
VVRKAVREIIKLVEILNSEGSSINLSIITFNDNATVYTMGQELNPELERKNIKQIVCSSFFDNLDIRPTGGTNFISAMEAFEHIKTPNTISVFLSDGEHSGNRSDVLADKFSNQITYSLGIGAEANSFDSELLKWIGPNFSIGSNEKKVEEILIGSIFSSLNEISSDITVDIIVPNSIGLVSSEVAIQSSPSDRIDIKDFDIDTILQIDMLTCGDKSILNIKPNSSIQNTNQIHNMDLVFIIDKSGSMDQPVENTTQTSNYLQMDWLAFDQNQDIFNLEGSDIDTGVQNLPLESVFDPMGLNLESSSQGWTKYTFTIDKLEKYNDFKFGICSASGSTQAEQIQVIVTTCQRHLWCAGSQSQGDRHTTCAGLQLKQSKYASIGIKPTTMENIWLSNENILLINALKKISKCTNESTKKEYIRELNSWISSPEYNEKILSVEANINIESSEYIKFSSIISQIKCLYNSIQTLGDLHYNYMRQFSMGDLSRDISTQTCRTQTQTNGPTSVRVVSHMTTCATPQIDSSDTMQNDMTLCCVCLDSPRQVLFSCGHIVTCIDCYKKISVGVENADVQAGHINSMLDICPDNKCVVCRQEIRSIKELNLKSGYICKTSGCKQQPTILDANCLTPVYCEPCWSRQMRKRKQDNTSIPCYCGSTCGITKYIKPNFV